MVNIHEGLSLHEKYMDLFAEGINNEYKLLKRQRCKVMENNMFTTKKI